MINKLVLCIISYLIGSIPFGLLIGKLQKKDLRELGSGNIGATNAARILGKKTGIIVLACDTLKSLSVCLVAKFSFPENTNVLLLVASLSVFGHIFPIYLKFKGGKGVATTLGCLFTFNMLFALFIVVCWIGSYLAFRISSLAAILSILIAIIMSYLLFINDNLFIFCVTIGSLVIYKHKENIVRLFKKSELKV